MLITSFCKAMTFHTSSLPLTATWSLCRTVLLVVSDLGDGFVRLWFDFVFRLFWFAQFEIRYILYFSNKIVPQISASSSHLYVPVCVCQCAVLFWLGDVAVCCLVIVITTRIIIVIGIFPSSIMSSLAFNQKRVPVIPPDKGSFPLDHAGECKDAMMDYMKCIKEHFMDNSKCRRFSLKYLECRMDKNLMAKEKLDVLGFGDFERSERADEWSLVWWSVVVSLWNILLYLRWVLEEVGDLEILERGYEWDVCLVRLWWCC